ncbi:unnamed protein product [Gongylonema pulchrum]|uniref:Uncharacterized protein n=1 Tax=Gongylonema pulchrum TaxID=637853 RepID=A0A183D751_9BILA|nr:unnamed protein product [Gongylonema pulchrum]
MLNNFCGKLRLIDVYLHQSTSDAYLFFISLLIRFYCRNVARITDDTYDSTKDCSARTGEYTTTDANLHDKHTIKMTDNEKMKQTAEWNP